MLETEYNKMLENADIYADKYKNEELRDAAYFSFIEGYESKNKMMKQYKQAIMDLWAIINLDGIFLEKEFTDNLEDLLGKRMTKRRKEHGPGNSRPS